MGSGTTTDTSSGLRCPPMNLIYLHYHNAIRAELDRVASSVNELEKAPTSDISDRLSALKKQYRFLEKIYKYHSSVEDEVTPVSATSYFNQTSRPLSLLASPRITDSRFQLCVEMCLCQCVTSLVPPSRALQSGLGDCSSVTFAISAHKAGNLPPGCAGGLSGAELESAERHLGLFRRTRRGGEAKSHSTKM